MDLEKAVFKQFHRIFKRMDRKSTINPLMMLNGNSLGISMQMIEKRSTVSSIGSSYDNRELATILYPFLSTLNFLSLLSPDNNVSSGDGQHIRSRWLVVKT